MLENLLSNDEIERFIQEGRAQVVLWIVRQPVLLERVQSSPLVSGNFQNAQILGPQRFHQLAAMPVHYDAKPLRGPKLSADPRNARESLYKIFPPRGARYRESVKMGGGGRVAYSKRDSIQANSTTIASRFLQSYAFSTFVQMERALPR